MAIVPGLGIVLGGTAPAMTLMSGAMLAFDEEKVDFEVISTTGVGGLIGMLYLAPKGPSREKALRELPNLFVSNSLYRLCPINFKVFYKYGPLAKQFWERRKSLPKIPVAPDDPSPVKRFVNDWLELWATVLTPASYESANKGFMSHVPLIDDLVNFEALKQSPTRFYLNAFSLWRRRLRFFNNDKTSADVIDADRYNGAQAMFSLFEPVRIPGDLLTTGATRDPTGLQAIWNRERGKLTRVLTLDPVNHCAWRTPDNAYDAFQIMLMNPIAALHELMLGFYGKTEVLVNAGAPPYVLPRLDHIPVTIDETYYPEMWKWTHANAMKLQDVGYRAAKPVAEALAAAVPQPPPPGTPPPPPGTPPPNLRALDALNLRYSSFVERDYRQARSRQFLHLFDPMMERENFPRFMEQLARFRPVDRGARS